MKVFFCWYQSANVESFSPSAAKPEQVFNDWTERMLITMGDKRNPKCLDAEDMYIAHDKAYIDGIMDCTIANGFGNKSRDVASTIRFTTGSMLSAAEYAIEHNEHTCSPTSGFHHAGYNFAGGYCTVNGLMIAAMSLHKSGKAKTVGILDLDFHLGNGTIDIIKRLDAKHVKHRTSGARFHNRRDAGENATSYFKWLEDAIEHMHDCDVILYQAGADAWVDDPLGGCLTLEELQQRDRMVFEGFQGKPLAWCLAGGYAKDDAGSIEPVLAIHRQTALECICASGKAQLQ